MIGTRAYKETIMSFIKKIITMSQTELTFVKSAIKSQILEDLNMNISHPIYPIPDFYLYNLHLSYTSILFMVFHNQSLICFCLKKNSNHG